jgi:hypothetical protein
MIDSRPLGQSGIAVAMRGIGESGCAAACHSRCGEIGSSGCRPVSISHRMMPTAQRSVR